MYLKKSVLWAVCLCLFYSWVLSWPIVINEIFYNPAESPEYLFEWVELYNAADDEVVMSSWSFIVGKSTYTFYSADRDYSVIAPESFAVLTSSGTKFLAVHPDFDQGLFQFTKTVQFSNTGKNIALKDHAGVIIDALTYAPQWNNNKENKSIERIHSEKASDDPSNWRESADIGGTPGRKNSTGVVSDTEQNEPTSAFQTAVVTEIAPMESSGKDWIEVYVLETVDISKLLLYESESVIKQFPSIVVEKGSLFVVHFNNGTADERGDINANGYLDFYSIDSGLTGTDNVISLRDAEGGIIDAVVYSNNDGDTFMPKTAYNVCAQAKVWEPAVASGQVVDYERASIDWSEGEEGYALARIRTSEGYPDAQRPGSKNKWVLQRYPNPGAGYGHVETQCSTVLSAGEPNPFSPDAPDALRRTAHIYFRVNQGSVKTIYVFDVHGRERIKLIDDDTGFSGESWSHVDEGEVLWDGADTKGRRLPIGIYILFLEAANPVTGAQQKGKSTIVIGGRL